MKLVAGLIVRNEDDRYLGPCLEHLLTYVDEIRVVDDGSDNPHWSKLKWIPNDPRIKIHRLPESTFYDNEGAARQTLLRWTLEADPTHVLAIDADEFVEDPPALISALKEGHDLLRLCMMEVWGCDEKGLRFRMDGGWAPHEAPLVYRLPSVRKPEWSIPQRKLASGRIPTEVTQLRGRARSSGVGIFHFGWACEADRVARHSRYAIHDGGNFHASSHLDSILWGNDDPRLKICRDTWPAGLASVREALIRRSNRDSD